MTDPIRIRWRNWAGTGLEHAEVYPRGKTYRAESVVIGEDDAAAFAMTYELVWDSQWRTRELSARILGSENSITLRSNGTGEWAYGNGTPLEHLRGCIDVDIMATPLTNTLPIRRLALREKESALIRVAYVAVPSLAIGISVQRYTCVIPLRKYRFELPESEFTRDIDVDDEGYVTNYPDLFVRTP